MDKNLRKHILSEYTNPVGFEIAGNLAIDAEAVEIADSDKFMLQSEGPTTLTETIEDSDPDEFHLFDDNSNSNNILMAKTRPTYIAEILDEDEFLLI